MAPKIRYLILLVILMTIEVRAFEINFIPYNQCIDLSIDEMSWENQRYWSASADEPVSGETGGCVIGFPKYNHKIDNAFIQLFPYKKSYRSLDKKLTVNFRYTKIDDSCEPDSQKCCGQTQYALLTFTKSRQSKKINAIQYSGG